MMMQQYMLALIEGIALILSPCILPVLPLVLAASVTGGRARPLGIIAGFILAFTGFALFARLLIQNTGIDTEIIRHVSLALLVLLGLTMLSQRAGNTLLRLSSGLAQKADTLARQAAPDSGFRGGIIVGLLIGLVWTPCAGPVMAAAIIQVVQAETDFHAALITLLFVTGAGLPMLALALFSRSIAARLSPLKQHAETLRRAMGVVIIVMAGLIWSGADIALTTAPGQTPRFSKASTALLKPLPVPYAAPEITGIESWINSQPQLLADLRGKVVLIDVWTYSCINCVRTMPYVTAWDRRYRDDGLVIIGIHTPEFPFEKKRENVQSAVKKYGIEYPVALDNHWQTWRALNNKYWPAHYLIDQSGQVVYTHFGEGNYDITENNIRYLLGIHNTVPGADIRPHSKAVAGQTPETYLGTRRAKNFLPAGALQHDTDKNYTHAADLPLHHWSLQGDWSAEKYSVTALQSGAALRLQFKAGRVFLVMGTLDGNPVDARILLNGEPVRRGKNGKDVRDGIVTVTAETIYEILRLPDVQEGTLEIQSERAGLQAYAFTFGK